MQSESAAKLAAGQRVMAEQQVQHKCTLLDTAQTSNSKLSILNPTPCILNPTPCILNPTPCILNPTPCILKH